VSKPTFYCEKHVPPKPLYYYWNAQHGQIVTCESTPDHVNGAAWSHYVQCNFLSLEDATAAHFGRKTTWTSCRVHGRDLHPLTEMEILAIHAHPNPQSIMPRAY